MIGLICWLINLISYPIWLIAWFKRHHTIRSVIIWAIILSMGIGSWLGYEIVFTVWGLVLNLAFAATFMIGQFLFLFTFLSSTKNIETVPGDKGEISFERDYFGNEYLVEAVREWVHMMTREGQKKAAEIGSESINGILLEGPPGTGKTLLARCLATDSGAAFIGMSAVDFSAMFIGVGPMKVMRTYSKARNLARRYGACIIFLDEADAIGGNRGGVEGDPRRGPIGGAVGGFFGGGGLGIMSKLLTELDGVREVRLRERIQNRMRGWLGISPIEQGLVMTIAATNRPDILDPALTRPGRIDKRIRVDLPDRASRRKIITGYLSKIRHDDSINVEQLVDDLQGVSPATIASAVQRGAARHAIKDGRRIVIMRDIEMALEEDIVGLPNPISDFDEEQEHQVAVHEAGHAIVAFLLQPERRVTSVSIVRRGSGILGYVRDVEKKEIHGMPLDRISASIMVALAGHYAVELVTGKRWTGATSDFQHVRWYMYALAQLGEFGNIPYKTDDPFSDSEIKKHADRYLQDAITGVKKLLSDNMRLLTQLSEELVNRKELSSEEFYAFLNNIGAQYGTARTA